MSNKKNSERLNLDTVFWSPRSNVTKLAGLHIVRIWPGLRLIHLPFAHHANRSLSFVHLLTKKQMEVIRWRMDTTEKRTYPSMQTMNVPATRGLVSYRDVFAINREKTFQLCCCFLQLNSAFHIDSSTNNEESTGI